ncbi:carboxypeptidase-like regulatory domain-containing protein [Salibacter sp.]|uniref:carboxypeptidase-like regulatory domain-containing protein n=1 Tax=Salibacter sp. TaxID=2010995 RepID=UPI002870ADFC|nr:carboxypeptidase-like regulatory domain-containing protein [Salibacter sp.]MDR9399119.1 carboxypeptidase-like regulatory domain-containing protein [Salibacter sp.]MDR9488172.1 carboxypeptidase-like regulatory domain-containing protein [Salibacter sp.]
MRLFLCLLFLNMAVSSFAICQNNTLIIKGTVYYKSNRLENVKVEVFANGKLTETVKSNSRGKFSLKLNGKGNYTLRFKKNDYFDRQMVFSAHPKNDFGRERFSFEIDMFKFSEDETPEEVTKVPLIEYIENESQFKFTQNL